MYPQLTDENRAFLRIQTDADSALLLRTTTPDGRSWGGFQWPTTPGIGCEPAMWDSTPVCGNGLHGLLWGVGDHRLLSWSDDALWYVIAASGADIVRINSDVKVPRAVVLCVGTRRAATEYLRQHSPSRGWPIVGLTTTVGSYTRCNGGARSNLVCDAFTALTGGDFSVLEGGRGSCLTAGHNSILRARAPAELRGDSACQMCGPSGTTMVAGTGSHLKWVRRDGSIFTMRVYDDSGWRVRGHWRKYNSPVDMELPAGKPYTYIENVGLREGHLHGELRLPRLSGKPRR